MGLRLSLDRSAFAPEEEVSGSLAWELLEPAETIAIRLFWRTEGKGTQDIEIVRELRFEDPGTQGVRRFSLPLPSAPFSFSGKLISLVWAVEAVARPGGSEWADIVLSPTREEIALGEPR